MMEQLANVDALSAGAARALAARSGGYNRLVVGSPDGEATAGELESQLAAGEIFSRPVTSANDAACVVSALWLWVDRLDESHRICQAIKTPGGSYLHAIVHRREGDFWNSKYWLGRAGAHPALAAIAARCRPIVDASPAGESLRSLIDGRFDASGFVDAVEQFRDRRDERQALLVAIQRVEWMTLTDHFIAAATA